MMFKGLLQDFFEIVKGTAPLLIALVALKVLFRSPFDSLRQFVTGLLCVLVGLFIFQRGVSMCLEPLATDVGESLVRLPYRGLIILVCLIIGFTATLVEPALQAVSAQADEVTQGSLNPKLLVYVTAMGSAIGMGLGIAKVLYNLPMTVILAPILVLLVVLVIISKDLYVGLAFDCAAATTGPVNIPINLAIALGLATMVAGVDPMQVGFGLVGLTCICSAASVMLACLR